MPAFWSTFCSRPGEGMARDAAADAAAYERSKPEKRAAPVTDGVLQRASCGLHARVGIAGRGFDKGPLRGKCRNGRRAYRDGCAQARHRRMTGFHDVRRPDGARGAAAGARLRVHGLLKEEEAVPPAASISPAMPTPARL